jgi:hypothetical protein
MLVATFRIYSQAIKDRELTRYSTANTPHEYIIGQALSVGVDD